MISVATINAQGPFQEALEVFQTAIQSGIRLQEESAQRLIGLLGKLGSPLDGQGILRTITTETSRAMQRNIDESIRLMNENTQAAMRDWQRALEIPFTPGQGPTCESIAELTEIALGALRSNARAVLQANGRALELWSQLAKATPPRP